MPVNRQVLQGDILGLLYFITAHHCIFSEHDKPDACVSLLNGIRLTKLEYAYDISMVEQTAEMASSRLPPLGQAQNRNVD